jgi:transaldolase
MFTTTEMIITWRIPSDLKKQKNKQMKENPLKKLEALGQSIWLDYIRRDMIDSGELQRLIEKDGLSGMTSNPSIFEKAIAESQIYDQDIHAMANKKKDGKLIYEALSQYDIKKAADAFRSVYEKTDGKDGYVSLEVNPHLANDTKGTIEEARRLWSALNRLNILIKVPATTAGLPAIRQLISEGINVNVTLLFGLQRYRQVIKAYIAGIKDRIGHGKSVKNIVSVASFFLSRIDAIVDPKEAEFVALGGEQAHFATKIRGQVAISSANLAYKIFKETFEREQFLKLGALPQKLLWASTSPKDPDYSDIKYVEALICPNTINTIPLKTLEAYRDHGDPALQLDPNLEQASWVLSELPEVGIDINKITKKLENDGVKKFINAFDKLLETITKKSFS